MLCVKIAVMQRNKIISMELVVIIDIDLLQSSIF